MLLTMLCLMKEWMLECMNGLSSHGILAVEDTLAIQSTIFTVLIECGIADSQMDADLETAQEPSLFFGHCFSHCLFRKVLKNYFKIILDLHISWKSNQESSHIPFIQFPVILISFIT